MCNIVFKFLNYYLFVVSITVQHFTKKLYVILSLLTRYENITFQSVFDDFKMMKILHFYHDH